MRLHSEVEFVSLLQLAVTLLGLSSGPDVGLSGGHLVGLEPLGEELRGLVVGQGRDNLKGIGSNVTRFRDACIFLATVFIIVMHEKQTLKA